MPEQLEMWGRQLAEGRDPICMEEGLGGTTYNFNFEVAYKVNLLSMDLISRFSCAVDQGSRPRTAFRRLAQQKRRRGLRRHGSS